MKLTIVYTNKMDKLKRAEFKGQNTDQYCLKGNMIQWYEIDGKRASYAAAFAIINQILEVSNVNQSC